VKEKSEKLENKRLAIIVMCAFAVRSASRMLHTASSESIRSEKRGGRRFVHPLLGVHGHRLERSVYAFCIRCVYPFYPFGLESKEEEKI